MFFEYGMPLLPAFPDADRWNMEQAQEREARLLKSCYPQTAAKIQRLVERECDRMEYDGSMMYDEYPDTFMMELICRRMEEELAQGEIEAQAERGTLSELIRVLFFNEIYRRRCRHRRCRHCF